MPDLNSDALGIWEHLKPAIDKEIEQKTRGMVQRRKMKVTTAPSISTGTIGVTEAFGTTEMVIPFATNLISATIGDMVWVEFMYGATNAFASMFASADEKDWDVAGDLSVGGNAGISGNLGVSGSTSLQNTTVNGVLDVTQRRCYNTLSSAGWYRILTFNSDSVNHSNGYAGSTIDFNIGYKGQNETHKISLHIVNGRIKFDSENSVSYSQLIDKIRYTKNGAVGYVDLHILGECPGLYVDFIVHDQPTKQYQYVAANLINVDPSPSGETIVVEYTFSGTAYSKTVSAEGTANGWDYILYTDKTIDATRKITDTVSNYSTVNGFYGYYIPNILTPFSMSNEDYYVGTEWVIGTGFAIPAGVFRTTSKFNAYALGTASGSQSVSLTMHIKGTIA